MATQIISSLAKAFVKPVVFSMIVAIPASVYITGLYLDNYAFQTEVNFSTYVLGIALSLLVASIPVVIQARVAARQNPVEALKDE